MFFDDEAQMHRAAKWVIRTFTACIVIYLGFRYIPQITQVIGKGVLLFQPILLGVMIAVILNVPMTIIENWLSKKTGLKASKRVWSIVLALLVVIGILTGVILLIVPELISAVQIIVQIILSGISTLSQLDASILAEVPVWGSMLSNLDMDWVQIKLQLEQWVKSMGSVLLNQAFSTVSMLSGHFMTGFLGLIFSIYMLSNKEKLISQIRRLIGVWMPRTAGETVMHIASVCNTTFQKFIAGQVTEAIILATLCTIGMLVLRIPYALMVGCLIGVTALIPIIGAFIGGGIGAIMILTVSPVKALIFIIFLVILQQLEGDLIYPRVVGAKINLSALWVLGAVTVGGAIAGPLGMLLGVPAVSALYTLVKEATINREQKQLSNSTNIS